MCINFIFSANFLVYFHISILAIFLQAFLSAFNQKKIKISSNTIPAIKSSAIDKASSNVLPQVELFCKSRTNAEYPPLFLHKIKLDK